MSMRVRRTRLAINNHQRLAAALGIICVSIIVNSKAAARSFSAESFASLNRNSFSEISESGAKLLEERGSSYGAGLSIIYKQDNKPLAELRARHWQATLDYSGQTQLGRDLSTKSDWRYRDISGAIFRNSLSLTYPLIPHLGLQAVSAHRLIKATPSTVAVAVEREFIALQLGLALPIKWRKYSADLSLSAHWSPDSDIQVTLDGGKLGTLKLDDSSGLGLSMLLSYSHDLNKTIGFKISASAQYWNWSASNAGTTQGTTALTFYEPEAKLVLVGMQIGFIFGQ